MNGVNSSEKYRVDFANSSWISKLRFANPYHFFLLFNSANDFANIYYGVHRFDLGVEISFYRRSFFFFPSLEQCKFVVILFLILMSRVYLWGNSIQAHYFT